MTTTITYKPISNPTIKDRTHVLRWDGDKNEWEWPEGWSVMFREDVKEVRFIGV